VLDSVGMQFQSWFSLLDVRSCSTLEAEANKQPQWFSREMLSVPQTFDNWHTDKTVCGMITSCEVVNKFEK